MDFSTNHLCEYLMEKYVDDFDKNIYTGRRSNKCNCVVGMLCASKSRHLSPRLVEMFCKQLFTLGCGVYLVVAESTRSSQRVLK